MCDAHTRFTLRFIKNDLNYFEKTCTEIIKSYVD